MNEGYIKLSRKMLSWEWYSDVNTTRLFVHLIFKANWKDGRFQGVEVPRGSLVTSLGNLARETGLSVREVRTSLNHLKTTGEVTSKRHAKFSVISIKNYCLYQDVDKQNDKQETSERQAIDKRATTIEERNKKKKEIREEDKTPVNGRGGYPTDIIDQYDFSEEMRAKIDEWLEYKKERRESYKSTGLTALLRKISQKSGEYGENPVMALMDECMANGWRGIIWDKLRTEKEDDNGGKQDDDDWDKYLKGCLTV